MSPLVAMSCSCSITISFLIGPYLCSLLPLRLLVVSGVAPASTPDSDNMKNTLLVIHAVLNWDGLNNCQHQELVLPQTCAQTLDMENLWKLVWGLRGCNLPKRTASLSGTLLASSLRREAYRPSFKSPVATPRLWMLAADRSLSLATTQYARNWVQKCGRPLIAPSWSGSLAVVHHGSFCVHILLVALHGQSPRSGKFNKVTKMHEPKWDDRRNRPTLQGKTESTLRTSNYGMLKYSPRICPVPNAW